MTRRSLLASFALAALSLAACSKNTRPRCAECGMFADVAPAWTASATSAGTSLQFDTPKCLFAYALRTRSVSAERVTEHYAQRLVPAESVAYVVGSDLVSPMGKDLVPVAREHAEDFARDHGGRVIELAEINTALLSHLE